MVQEYLEGAVVTAKENSIENNIEVYFDIIQEHSVSIQNSITDNYLENNTAIHDHIGHSPIVLNLRGLSGELVYVPSTNKGTSEDDGWLYTAYQNVNNRLPNKILETDKLLVIPELLPPVDNVTQMAKNIITYTEASTKRYDKIISNFRSPMRRQYMAKRLKEIYQALLNLRETNAALIVNTPYEKFDDMYIQSITLRQGNDLYITDIELSLKQLKFTDTLTTEADQAVLDKYNAYMRSQEQNHGKTQGPQTDNSTLLGGFVKKMGVTQFAHGNKN